MRAAGRSTTDRILKSATIHIWSVLLACIAGMASAPATDLSGVWEAARHFGPELRGPLLVTRDKSNWTADIAGQRTSATIEGAAFHLTFSAERGEFHGTLDAKTNEIRGHWIQPATVSGGLRYASPVTLKSAGKDQWRGVVVPVEDEITLFLVATAGENGVVHAFLRNPELNVGVFLDIDRLDRDGDAIKLIGHRRGQNDQQVLAQGIYHSGDNPSQDQISIYFPNLNGTYDFSRASDNSLFYAHGKTPAEYIYSPPPSEEDGWQTATLSDAGISEAPIKKLIETVIDPPAKSVHDPYIHGILIARHGKLVFEEYFHGFHREKPHDTRSASKSLTATLMGSLIAHGAPISVSTPVYKMIYGDQLPADLDPRKKQMTAEHLLMMASGYYCDDNDPSAPGNEDVMQSQTADRTGITTL